VYDEIYPDLTVEGQRGSGSLSYYLMNISIYSLYGIYSGCVSTRKVYSAAPSAVLLLVLVYFNNYFRRKLCSQALNMDSMRMCVFVQERLGGQGDQGLLGYFRLMYLPKKQFADFVCVLKGCF